MSREEEGPGAAMAAGRADVKGAQATVPAPAACAKRCGEARRDAALLGVTGQRRAEIWEAQARMISAALERDQNVFTGDDATQPGHEYEGNAPWIGAAVRDLAARPWVEPVGFVRSARASRKGNHVRLWRITDPAAAAGELARLRRLLGALDDPGGGASANSGPRAADGDGEPMLFDLEAEQ